MGFLTCEAAQHAFALANILCDRAGEGLEIVLSPTDMELAALGLFVIVILSDQPQSDFEGTGGQD